MIAEISASHRAAKTFLQVARRLTGRPEPKKARGAFLQPFLGKLRGRRGAA
jgi:pilus assembly protein CpaE